LDDRNSYCFIFIFILIFSFHVLLLFLLSLIPSINLCSVAFSSISNNFECGFYSIIISSLRYRFNYWLILFHFPISEQESILATLLVYGIQTLNSNWIIIILYIISFIDSWFFSYYFTYFDAAYIKPNKFCSILGCLFLLEHLLLNILGCLPISHVTSFHSKTNN